MRPAAAQSVCGERAGRLARGAGPPIITGIVSLTEPYSIPSADGRCPPALERL
jgi:hypothetical protein